MHQKMDADRLDDIERRMAAVERAISRLILDYAKERSMRRKIQIGDAERERDLVLKISRRLDS